MSKPALGRGLGALLGGAAPTVKPPPAPATAEQPNVVMVDSQDRVRHVSLLRIKPCPFQPRKDFSAESLAELADSIRAQGILQPLVVRPAGESFELIAGERRWRAAQLAGLTEAPIIVREADDRAVLELALIENLQRENLNPIEEAQGYAQLIEQFHLKQEEAAAKVGKSRAVVANALRLLKLPSAVQSLVREGTLSVGHAKVILALPTEKEQRRAVEQIIKDGLNVRQTEQLVARFQSRSTSPLTPNGASGTPVQTHVSTLEDRLRERLGTKVRLRYAQGKGAVEITFFSDDELERILHLLGITAG